MERKIKMGKLLSLSMILALVAASALASQQSASVTVTINVVGLFTATTPVSIAAIAVGQPYSATIATFSGGVTPYACSADSTTPLPSGLTMAVMGNNCILSGTLTSFPGSSLSLKINAHDSSP